MAKIDIKVRELVDKVNRGELTLPEMQRRYVWPATRVRDLLDSLYRGYPSGTILTWETDEEMSTRDLAVSPTLAPATTRKLLLLDGQQRITSLSAVLGGKPIGVRSKNKLKQIDILFNLDHPDGPPSDLLLDEEDDFTMNNDDTDDDGDDIDIQAEMSKRTFVVSSSSLKHNPIWVPVSDIFIKTDKDILKPIGINSDDDRWDKYSARLQKIRNIQEYQYVMQVLEKDLSYEEVTEIFVRVNSLGIKLRGSDLAMAQITSKWKGFTSLSETFAKEFSSDEDYLLDTGLLVRALVVFATKQSRFKTVGRISKNNLEEAWKKAQTGLRFAINFVKSNAGIGDLSQLSSPFILIPLAVISVLKKEQFSESDTVEMLRWLYIAHMRGHYSMGSSDSILDADLSILFKGGDIKELLNQLYLHVKKINVDESDLVNKGTRSPFFSMLYFIFKKSGVKDWVTGIKLSDRHVGRAHTIQAHHIFPKSILKEHGYNQKEINEIANMAFIAGKTNRAISNKEPLEYLDKEIIQKRGEDAITSQLITLDRTLWSVSKFQDFLTDRRRKIAQLINDHLDNLNKEVYGHKSNYENIISGGENNYVEFKSSLRWDHKTKNVNKTLEHAIAKTIAAFMNANGGQLFIGIDDNGVVLGLEDDCATLKKNNTDGFQLQLAQVIDQYIGKEYGQYIQIKMVNIEKKDVCIIEVKSSLQPVFIKNTDKEEFFVRIAASSQPMNVREASEYIRVHWMK